LSFYFVVETAGRGKLHFQGSMLITHQEQAMVKEALSKVNRKMTISEKQHFLDFGLDSRQKIANTYGNLYATLRWSSYNIKEYRLNRIAYSLKSLIASSSSMTKLAQDYHADFRRIKKQSALYAARSDYA